jgi:hypothetical protein
MALITGIGLFVMSVLLAALSRIAAEEVAEWIPSMIRSIIRLAVARLPVCQRERFEEEWQSHMSEVPGKLGKLLSAAGLLLASRRMASIARRKKVDNATLFQIDEVLSKTTLTANTIRASVPLAASNPLMNELTLNLSSLRELRNRLASEAVAAPARPTPLAVNPLRAWHGWVERRKSQWFSQQISRLAAEISEKNDKLLKAIHEAARGDRTS